MMNILINISYIILITCYLFPLVQSFHDLCAKSSSDHIHCDNKLWTGNLQEKNICTLKFYPSNSSECSALKFQNKISNPVHLGNVHIKPYLWDFKDEHNYNYTLFDVTFSDIQWKRMKFRFEITNNNTNDDYKNHCREIFLDGEVPDDNDSLSYDCHWSDQDHRYENETFSFEYEAESSMGVFYGKYIFIVPPTNILAPLRSNNEFVPFIYLDVTKDKIVKVHISPPKDSEQTLKYTLSIFLQQGNTIKKTEEVLLTSDAGQEIVHTHKILSPGTYSFQVTQISPTCVEGKCRSVFGPYIRFDYDESTICYTILWSALCLAMLLLLIWFMGACKKKWMKKPPCVLLIHAYGDSLDIKLTKLLGDYMTSYLNWTVMVERDICQTQHGDPYIWCLESFNKADFVIYIVNPELESDSLEDGKFVSINLHLDKILHKFAKNDTKVNGNKVVNVIFDHYKDKEIPLETRSDRTFYLLKDWYSLLHYINRNRWWYYFISPFPQLKNSPLGKEILQTFVMAKNDL